jgi:hypothetical protein
LRFFVIAATHLKVDLPNLEIKVEHRHISQEEIQQVKKMMLKRFRAHDGYVILCKEKILVC